MYSFLFFQQIGTVRMRTTVGNILHEECGNDSRPCRVLSQVGKKDK